MYVHNMIGGGGKHITATYTYKKPGEEDPESLMLHSTIYQIWAYYMHLASQTL